MLQATLDRHTRNGALSRTHGLGSDMFTATAPLGAHRGKDFDVVITVIAHRNGTHRTSVEIWSGDQRVKRAPLEANWPVVKAVREIAAGNQQDEVIARLLDAAL